MWKGTKSSKASSVKGFSLVSRYIQKFEDVSGTKRVKKRSRLPGLMLGQFEDVIPEGENIPVFLRKPVPLTVEEGNAAVFRAKVTGQPKPQVTWKRAKGDMSDQDRFMSKYDESTGECSLQIPTVCEDDRDTYKCFAVNKYGKAVCTAALNVIVVAFNKQKEDVMQDVVDPDPAEFRKLLRKSKEPEDPQPQPQQQVQVVKREDGGEVDESFWDILMSSEKRDYERICADFGVKDLRGVLRRLEEKKQEREDERSKGEQDQENILKSVGKKTVLGVHDRSPEDAGRYQVHVDRGVKMLSAEFKVCNVGFVVKIEEVKAQEGEDAVFECVLTLPMSKIRWMGKNAMLLSGDKHSFVASEDKLTHRLLIKDARQADRGVYAAIAGAKSCSAWLLVGADADPAYTGKKREGKTTSADGAGSGSETDLEKMNREQQEKEMNEAIMKIINESAMSNMDESAMKMNESVMRMRNVSSMGVTETTETAEGAMTAEEFFSAADGRLTGGDKTSDGSRRGVTIANGEDRSVTDTLGARRDMLTPYDQASIDADTSGKVGKTEHGEAAGGRRGHGRDVAGGWSGDGVGSAGGRRGDGVEGAEGWRADGVEAGGRRGDGVATAGDQIEGGMETAGGWREGGMGTAGGWREGGMETAGGWREGGMETAGGWREGGMETAGGWREGGMETAGGWREGGMETAGGWREGGVETAGGWREGGVETAGGWREGGVEVAGGRREDGSDALDSNGVRRVTNNDGVDLMVDDDENRRRTQTRVRTGGVAGQDLEDTAGLWESTDSTKHPMDSKQAAQKAAQKGGQKAGLTGGQGQPGVLSQHHITGDNEALGDCGDSEDYNELDYGEEGRSVKPTDTQHDHVTGGKGTGENTDVLMHSRRKRPAHLILDTEIGAGVHFVRGLCDVTTIVGQRAEMSCKLSADHCDGCWFKDGKKISPAEGVLIISQEGCSHRLVIVSCEEEHSGTYRFEADGRKTEATVQVKAPSSLITRKCNGGESMSGTDPPRVDPGDLASFSEPLTVRAGHNAVFKLPFLAGGGGGGPAAIGWFLEGEELHDQDAGSGGGVKIERFSSHSRLLLSKVTRRTSGTVTLRLRNQHGATEATTRLIVLDKPTSPLGPAEVLESSGSCIHFKWRPPKDNGGSEIISYTMERQQVGRNTWKKLGETPGVPCYRDTDVELGRRYCYRIRAVTSEGFSDLLETEDLQAGTLAFPGAPAPPTVVSSFKDVINLCWAPPAYSGGSRILGYILEKRKNKSNLWTVINPNELIKEKKCSVTDVVEGMEYEFRVAAINLSGPGEYSNPSEFVYARDPKKPPGKVTAVKVTDTSYSHFSLSWTKPEVKEGVQDEAKGYFMEVRQTEVSEWSRCNVTPVLLTSYSLKGLKPMDMYWVRVIATNYGGDGPPQDLDKYILVMPLPIRPRFTDNKIKTFMVVRAGNSVRININFEASPHPDVRWLKDNAPVSKRVTVSNSEGSSQMLIPTSERSDSGVYTVLVKNMVGQETVSMEVRVTDDPKPPGPIELEENVSGTVTVSWDPSPDEKRDDHLHYVVSKLDSAKRTWSTVAERLFNHKLTVCNIMPGREYHFRVYARNDMGTSVPSESPTWGREKTKEKFVVNVPTQKDCDLRCVPAFIVPLKLHSAPQGYECYMSCAVKGDPKPRITWFRNNVSLNTDTNYYISNTCGVCSLLILRVGAKDMGEYSVSAENHLGRALCSTILSVRE